MPILSSITPLLLTFNEAPNIGRALERLTWAQEILVVDSFSTDETLHIVKSFPQVRVLQRKFDDHTTQWNFGLEAVGSRWVLTLDADYVLPKEFLDELHRLPLNGEISAFFASFRYCIGGKPLRACLYPPRAVLFRKDKCHYSNDGHTQLLEIAGKCDWLRTSILHDDRKPLDRWLSEQNKYAVLEASHLLQTPREQLNFHDRLRRRIVLAPVLVFFYTLLGKGLILDGWPGWYYVFQRTLAETLLSLRLLEGRFHGTTGQQDH